MLYSNEAKIETKIDKEIIWDRKDGRRATSIYVKLDDVRSTDESNWEIMASFHAEYSKKIADYLVYEYWDEIKSL